MSDHDRDHRHAPQPPQPHPRVDRAGAGPTTRSLSPMPRLQRAAVAASSRPPPDPHDADVVSPRRGRPMAAFAPFDFLDDLRATTSAAASADTSGARAIQRRATGPTDDSSDPSELHAIAAGGITGAAQPLPHLRRIQQAFGPDHDVTGVHAHVGGPAVAAADQLGAAAYATGDHVAFAATPDVHTAAHEAAHIIQQRRGVSLAGGIGQVGDAHEQHADAIADAVVAGRDASGLLGPGTATAGATGTSAIQRKGASADQLAGIAAAQLAPTEATAGTYRHVTHIEDAKTRAQRVLADWRAGGVTLDAAASRLAVVIDAVLVDLHALATDDTTAHDTHAAAEAQRYRPAVHDALTNIARVALQLVEPHRQQDLLLGGALTRAARPPDLRRDDQAVANLTGLLATLQTMGQPLGWTAPSTVADAQRARFAFEACPTGADTERPDQCSLPDAERVGLRAELGTAAIHVVSRFERVAGDQRARLAKLIGARQAGQKLVLDLIGDLFTMATRATGAAPIAMLGLSLALKIGKAQVPADHVEGQDTATMLEALTSAMTAALEGVSADAAKLDDNELRTAIKALNGISTELLAARLHALVAAYGQQIDPIGHDASGVHPGGFPGQLRGTYRAVRIPRPDGRVRLALVAADQGVPSPTEAALSGQPIGARASVMRGTFVRWIAPQFEPVVGDAPTVRPQDDIADVPLVDPTDLTTPGAP
ncbi:MAG: DUF4157 domain-containing protein [Kofleriaceae bacterium]